MATAVVVVVMIVGEVGVGEAGACGCGDACVRRAGGLSIPVILLVLGMHLATAVATGRVLCVVVVTVPGVWFGCQSVVRSIDATSRPFVTVEVVIVVIVVTVAELVICCTDGSNDG